MADVVSVHTASGVVYSGQGQLYALVLTASVGQPLMTLTDSITGPGTKLLEVYGSVSYTVIIFFSDKFALRFVTGLYVTLAANLIVTLWTRQL